MSNVTIATIEDEQRTLNARVQAIIATAEAESRDLTAEEDAETRSLLQRMRTLDTKRRARGNGPGLEDMIAQLRPAPASSAAASSWARHGSIGDAFTRSGAVQGALANLPTSAPWRTGFVEVPFNLQAAALLSPAPGWRPDVAAPAPVPVLPPPPRPSSLFMPGTASGGVVSYLRDSGQAKTAAVVAEGATKPELSLVLPQIDAPLVTIAVWAAVSNQTVEDVVDFREWLDNVFALDVLDKLDDEVLNGTGTGGRMLGVRLCPGLAGPVALTAPETAADAIARAIAAVYAASRLAPDAIVIDPGAFTALLTLKASTSGVYLSGAAMSSAPISLLWGVPVVPSPAMPAGEALVGNFRRGGALYSKQGLRMMASTEHADFFTKNLTAVLGELRAVLAVQRPPAFCKVTGLPVPAP